MCSLAAAALSSFFFSPLFHLPPGFNLPSLTCPFSAFYPLSFSSYVPLSLALLASNHGVLSRGDLTLRGYCVRKMILISAHSAELSCKLPFPHGDAAKLTGTNSL